MTRTDASHADQSDLERLIAAHSDALKAFENDPGEGNWLNGIGPLEAAYHAALDDLGGYVARTPLEFVRHFSACFHNRLTPNEDAMAALVNTATILSSMPIDPHMGWLAERDALLTQFNAAPDIGDDGPEMVLYRQARDIEHRISETPATTRDGVLAKALLIVGQTANEFDAEARPVFDEAKALGLIEWEA